MMDRGPRWTGRHSAAVAALANPAGPRPRTVDVELKRGARTLEVRDPPPTGGGVERLLGRSAECDLLEDLMRSARSGTSAVVVLRGGAGVGKSALLNHAVGS